MASPFPKSQRAAAWLALVDILKNDPYLSRVHTWRVWDGDPGNTDQIVDGLCPALRITPYHDKAGPITDSVDTADLLVAYEPHVAGYDVTDLMALDEAVYRAVFPLDPDRAASNQATFDDLGTLVTWEKWAIWDSRHRKDFARIELEAKNTVYLHAEGLIRMQFNFQRGPS